MKQQNNKILIQVECCTDCHSHSWCSRHDESKYNSYFEYLKEKLEQNIPDVKVVKNYVPQFFEKLGQKSNFGEHKYVNLKTEQQIFFPKFGAFEVYVKQILIFSKLKSGLWPKIDRVVQLVEQVVKGYRNEEDISKFSLNYRLRNDRQTFFVQTYRAQIVKQRSSSQERLITNQNVITPGRKNFNLRKVLSKSRPKNQSSQNRLTGSAIINNKKFNLYNQIISQPANRPKTRDFNIHRNKNLNIHQDQKLQSAPNNFQIQQWNILQGNQASTEQKSPFRHKTDLKKVKTMNRDSIRIKINEQSNKNSNIKKLIQKKGLQTNKIKLNNNVISKQQTLSNDKIKNQTKSPKLTKNHQDKASHINYSNRQRQQQQKIKKKQKDSIIKQQNDNTNKFKSGSMNINAWSNKETDSNLQTDNIINNSQKQIKKQKKPSISQGIDQKQSYQNQFIIQNQQKLEHQSNNTKTKQQTNNNSKSAQNLKKQVKMRETFLSNQKTINNNNNEPEFQQVISQLQEQNKNNKHGSGVNSNQLAKSHNLKAVKNGKHQQLKQNNVIQQSVIIKKNQQKQKLQHKEQQQYNKNREREYATVYWNTQFINNKYQLSKDEQSQQYSQILDDPQQSIVKPLELSEQNDKKQQVMQKQNKQANENQYQQDYNQIQQNNKNSVNPQDEVSENIQKYQQIEWQTYYKRNSFVLVNSEQHKQQQYQLQNQNIIQNCIENQINQINIQIVDKYQGNNTQILQQNNKQHNQQQQKKQQHNQQHNQQQHKQQQQNEQHKQQQQKEQHKYQQKQQNKQQQELLVNYQQQQMGQYKKNIENNKIIYENIQWQAKYQNNKYSLLTKSKQLQVQQLQSSQQLQLNQKQPTIQKQQQQKEQHKQQQKEQHKQQQKKQQKLQHKKQQKLQQKQQHKQQQHKKQQNAEQPQYNSQRQSKIANNQQQIVQQHQTTDNKQGNNIRYWIAKYQNQSFILQQHQ